MTESGTASGRYLWLDITFAHCPPLAFLTNSVPSEITARETWRVHVERTDAGARVHVGDADTLARDAKHLGEVVYGAVHDRVLQHAREDGWFRLHMALVEVAGRRVALVGRSGSGKSTTTVALAVRGAKVYGDDVVFVRDGQTIALPRPLHLREGAAARLAGTAWSRALPLDYAPPVFVLDPAGPGWAPVKNTVAPIDLIVVLDGPEPSSGTPTLTRALVELLSGAGAFNPRHGDLVREVSSMLARTPVVVVPRRDPIEMARSIEVEAGR